VAAVVASACLLIAALIVFGAATKERLRTEAQLASDQEAQEADMAAPVVILRKPADDVPAPGSDTPQPITPDPASTVGPPPPGNSGAAYPTRPPAPTSPTNVGVSSVSGAGRSGSRRLPPTTVADPQAWRTDWNAFVLALARDISAGAIQANGKLGDYAGAVHWRGQIEKFQFPELDVKMATTQVPLPSGWRIVDTVRVRLKTIPTGSIAPGVAAAFYGTLPPSPGSLLDGVTVMTGTGPNAGTHLVMTGVVDGGVE